MKRNYGLGWWNGVTVALCRTPVLTTMEFRIFLHILACTQQKRPVLPTFATIKRETGVSNGSVRRAISALESKGFLKVSRSKSEDGSNAPNVYEFGPSYDPDGHGGWVHDETTPLPGRVHDRATPQVHDETVRDESIEEEITTTPPKEEKVSRPPGSAAADKVKSWWNNEVAIHDPRIRKMVRCSKIQLAGLKKQLEEFPDIREQFPPLVANGLLDWVFDGKFGKWFNFNSFFTKGEASATKIAKLLEGTYTNEPGSTPTGHDYSEQKEDPELAAHLDRQMAKAEQQRENRRRAREAAG